MLLQQKKKKKKKTNFLISQIQKFQISRNKKSWSLEFFILSSSTEFACDIHLPLLLLLERVGAFLLPH